MFQKLLKKHYGIDAKETMPLGRYQSCKKDNQRYIFVPVGNMEDEELSELEQIVNHLKKNGDQYVSTFLYTKEKSKS